MQDLLRLITLAQIVATEAHKDQRRNDKDETPYINHPVGVMSLLREVLLNEVVDSLKYVEILSTGLLHDVLEDTFTTEKQLQEWFGHNITNYVKWCTDDKNLSKLEKKKKQIEKANDPDMPWEAKLVKFVDIVDNLSSERRTDWSPKKFKGYLVWKFYVVEGLRYTSKQLEEKIDQIFHENGISTMTHEEREQILQEYYDSL